MFYGYGQTPNKALGGVIIKVRDTAMKLSSAIDAYFASAAAGRTNEERNEAKSS
jgi:hypothetical protein